MRLKCRLEWILQKGGKKKKQFGTWPHLLYIYLTYKLTTCLSDDSKNRSTKAMCNHNSMWLWMLPPLSRLCCAMTFKATARLGYTVHSSACKMWLQVMQSNPSALRSTRQRSASSVKCPFCSTSYRMYPSRPSCWWIHLPTLQVKRTQPPQPLYINQLARILLSVSQSMMSMYMELDRRERKSLKVSDIPGSQRPNHVHLGLKLMCYSAFEQFSIWMFKSSFQMKW